MMAFPSRGQFSGGGRTTMRSLIPRLMESDDIETLHVAVPEAERENLGDLPVEIWPADAGLRGACRWLKQRTLQLRPDVLFLTNAHAIDVDDIPTVCTVRNTEPMIQPLRSNPLLHGLRCVLRGRKTREACRKATRVIAVSDFVREKLEACWNIPSSKIGVVHHGSEPPLPASEIARPDRAREVAEGEFLFSAGDFTAYRGYEDLLQAVANRRALGRSDRVLLAGGPIRLLEREHRRIIRLIGKLGLQDHVTLLGHIPRPQMAWCYRHCKAMVMTSRIEACPNVTLEAMRHGCVIISSDRKPMPEMFGEAALYYEAQKPDALQVLLAAVDDMTAEERDARRQIARSRGAEFSWDRACRNTIEQLRLAIETGKA